MSFIRLPNNKQESTHPTLSFRAGPIRMGRAKNLPVGGNGARVRRLCLLVCAPAGGDPSACGRQDDTHGANRMTLKDLNQARQQDPLRHMSFITLPNNRQKFTHPALSFRAGPIRMGGAKNLPVGGKGAGVCRRCLLACPPSRGRSSLPLAGASEPPAGVRMTREGGILYVFVGE